MTNVSFTAVDFLVVVVLLGSAAYSIWRGLLRETLGVFAWAFAAWSTLRFFSTFRPLLRDAISPTWLADVATAVSIFLIVLIPLSVMGYRFSQTVQRSEIGPVDRTLGMVFGLGRGLVIIGLAYIAFASLVGAKNQPTWLTRSRTLPLIQGTAGVLLSLVPDGEASSARQAAKSGRSSTPPRSEASVPQPQPKPQTTTKNNGKTYGADDRRALDRLIETTGER